MSSVNKLQLLQQNVQQLTMQKQQFQEQLTELDSALLELGNTDKAYRIIGKIMISTPSKTLAQDLQEKREIVEVRIKNIEKQEEKLKQNMEEAQQEVLKELKSKKN